MRMTPHRAACLEHARGIDDKKLAAIVRFEVLSGNPQLPNMKWAYLTELVRRFEARAS